MEDDVFWEIVFACAVAGGASAGRAAATADKAIEFRSERFDEKECDEGGA